MRNPVEKPRFVESISTTINTRNQPYQIEGSKYSSGINLYEVPDCVKENALEDFRRFPYISWCNSDDNLKNSLFLINNEDNNDTQNVNDIYSINLEKKGEEEDKGKDIKLNSYCGFLDANQNSEKQKNNYHYVNINYTKKRKRYNSEDNKEKKFIEKQKTFFTYKEKEDHIKIGNNTKKKSKREYNQIKMIKRNLIQDIFRNWINYGESNKLSKLDPDVLVDDFRDRDIKLKEIYSKTITKKKKKKNLNIEIINKADGIDGMKKLKLNISFKFALNLFFENIQKNDLIKSNQQLKEYIGNKEDKYFKQFLEGLQTSEEYLKQKGGRETYKKKLKKTLSKFKQEYINNNN